MNDSGTLVLEGLGVSPGVAIGRAVCIETHDLEVYRFPLLEFAVDSEVERLHEAVQHAQQEIESTRDKAHDRLGEQLASIFEAHLLLLADRHLLGLITKRIRDERVNAEWAVHKTTEELLRKFELLEDPTFRERRDDLSDVTRQLLRSLQGVSHHELSELEGDVIIVTHDLTPSEAVRLGRQHVVAFAIETGGPTSHTAIIARDLNIPLVTALSDVTGLVTDDDPVIVDGSQGRVVLHPSDDDLAEYRRLRTEHEDHERELLATRLLPCVSRDGVSVELMANIDLPEEIVDATRHGAAGIGLYRSEFLYIETAPALPTESEHIELYSQLLDRMRPSPVFIRTFDLGGRKLAREVMATDEENPVLGLRGIRLTLARKSIFEVQLRSLLQAGFGRELFVMLPMVSSAGEIDVFRAFLAEVMAGLDRDGVPYTRDFKLGIMIEVPSAALIADVLARKVDFFSIGTNDLIQYSLAVDRNNEHVSYLYSPLHPGILRMIRFVLDSARTAGIDVSMCGEMAADPHTTALLLGMGLRRFSVSPRTIPEVKARIREVNVSEMQKVARHCLTLDTSSEIETYLETSLQTESVRT